MSDLEIMTLTRKLIDYQLPANRLPLCDRRRPFADLSPEMVSEIVRRAVSCAELRGRLTDSVREVAGMTTAATIGDFVIFEAHIDLTDVDERLGVGLLRLGFEPDDFAKMAPPEYRHHYTLQYVIPLPSDRLRFFQSQVADAGTQAARLIQQHGCATGYVETETYRSKYMTRFPFREFPAHGDVSAPVESSYQLRTVPTSQEEAIDSGLPLDVRRAADIHVKIPGDFAEYNGVPVSERVEAADESCPAGRARLRETLTAHGFYEIVSEAGNYLYSAHFADIGEANSAYWQLVAFARKLGGITGVVREACTGVWRKTVTSSAGTEVLARVPPLLRISWTHETR
jgi:hypothetical protein